MTTLGRTGSGTPGPAPAEGRASRDGRLAGPSGWHAGGSWGDVPPGPALIPDQERDPRRLSARLGPDVQRHAARNLVDQVAAPELGIAGHARQRLDTMRP